MAEQDLPQNIADELAIRNVIKQTVLQADIGDVDDYANCFTEDMRWEMVPQPGKAALAPPVMGRANMATTVRGRRAMGAAGPGTHHYHLVDTMAVEIDGDTASATSFPVFLKNAHKKPEVSQFRVYCDQLPRTPEGWKIAVRMIDPP